jgi:hypothetical protein
MVGDVHHGRNLRADAEGSAGDAEALGHELAERLLALGGGALLRPPAGG